jgi:small neutral amino acid transporter SnatA (MarC family)
MDIGLIMPILMTGFFIKIFLEVTGEMPFSKDPRPFWKKVLDWVSFAIFTIAMIAGVWILYFFHKAA